MDENQQRWSKQFWSHFGANEYVRFTLAGLVWGLAGLALSIALHAEAVFGFFLFSMFVFPLIATRWRPAYRIYWWILGNKGLPEGPYPKAIHRVPPPHLPGLVYVLGIWFLLLD